MVQRFALPVLLASLATLATTASAADTIASGSASVTGLSYHLIDLDPNDGIAPSITFNDSYVGIAADTGTSANQQFTPAGEWVRAPGDLFTSAPVNWTSSSGNVTGNYNSNSAAISTTLRGADLNAMATGLGGDGYSVTLTAASGMFYGKDEFPDYPGVLIAYNPGQSSFTLSANTALVIDGQWHVNASLDLNQLASGAFLNSIQANAWNAFVVNHVAAGVALQLDNGQDGVFAYNSVQYSQALDGNGPGELFSQRDSEQSDAPFSVQINNASASSANGMLILGAEADYSVSVAVPEPGTWVLMGLGLVGIGVVARRRRDLA